jgi:hypothetical protein
MFVNEWPLFVGVTLDASSVGARREPSLFQFEATVRVMAIAALHDAFQNLVMERHIELVLRFAVATEAELRLAGP